MVIDQTSPDFLAQLKDLAKGFLAWVSEEGQESEHPGMPAQGDPGTPPQGVTPDEQSAQPQPQLLRTKTTTVHDFVDPNVATDPPVSQAQRGAMHAAAGGNSTLGIPQSVGREFANADPGGKLPDKKGIDASTPTGFPTNLEDRFSLTPDQAQIIDNHTGRSFSIEDVLGMFAQQGGDTASMKPQTQVSVAQPSTNIATAQWKSPKISTRDDTLAGGQLGASGGGNNWNPNQKPMGEGEGGKVLGQLLKYKAGEDCGDSSSCGWTVPTSDYGTSEGARKRGQGNSPQTEQARQSLRSMTPEQWRTGGGKEAQQRLRDIWPGSEPAAKDYGTSEGARKRGQGVAGWEPRDLSKAGYGGASAAKSYPEGFVQGVGGATSKPKPREQYQGYDSTRRAP